MIFTHEKYLPIYEELKSSGFAGKLSANTPLAKYTTYGIGGPAAIFAEAWNSTDLELIHRIKNSYNLDSFVIGGGANVLIADHGFDGIAIKLGGEYADYSSEGTTIVTGSAVQLNKIVREGCRIGLAGIERLAGIPGLIGGALVMNAGTFGENFDGILREIEVFAGTGAVRKIAPEECGFAYRTSIFQTSNHIILGCTIHGEKGDPKTLLDTVKERVDRRNRTQPVTHPSCGCVFKNPDGDKSAGRLIDEAGLKGLRSGGAVISDQHANFIINEGSGKASDVLFLMRTARNKVIETTGIKLSPEVKGIGFGKSIEEILESSTG